MKVQSESKKRAGRTTVIMELPAEVATALKTLALAVGRHLRAEAEDAFTYWMRQTEETRQRHRASRIKLHTSDAAKKSSKKTAGA